MACAFRNLLAPRLDSREIVPTLLRSGVNMAADNVETASNLATRLMYAHADRK